MGNGGGAEEAGKREAGDAGTETGNTQICGVFHPFGKMTALRGLKIFSGSVSSVHHFPGYQCYQSSSSFNFIQMHAHKEMQSFN